MNLDQTTIGELYSSLAPLEIKQLDGYIRGMGSDKSYRLHKCFVRILKNDQMKTLDYDYVKRKAFRSETMIHSSFTTEINLVANLVKEYFILAKTKEKNLYTETLWGEILIERGLRRNLLIKLKNFKYDLYKDQYAIMKMFFHKRERFYYQFISHTKKTYDAMIASQLEQMNSFKEYFHYYTLELYNSLYSLSRQNNKQNILDSQEILDFSKKSIESNNELILIQSVVINLSITNNQIYYNRLKELFFNKFDLLSTETIASIFPTLLNFGINKINNGEDDYELKNYELLKFLYDKNVLFNSSYFSILRFVALIRSELKYGSIDKAKLILENNLSRLPTNQKQSFENLIRSRIEFAAKNYKSALRYISQLNLNDSIYYFVEYKTMLLKCHVMLEDIDRVQAEKDNFYKYVHKNSSLPEDAQARHKLFIRYSEYLLDGRYLYLPDQHRRSMETALLPSSPYFTEKEWVRERWNSLKAKYQH